LLALALAAASFFAYQQGERAADERIAEQTASAEHVATALASTLTQDDLDGPVGDERSQEISAYLGGGVLRPEETLTVLNKGAMVVFAPGPEQDTLGTRRSRTKVTRALSLGTQIELGDGTFDVFVPVTVGNGSDNAIVQISRSSEPIEAARRIWIIVALVAAGFAVLVLVSAFIHGGRLAGFGDAISPSRMLDIERRHQKELEGLEKTLERARGDEAGLQEMLERTSNDLDAHKRVLNELDEALTKAEARAGEAEGQLADARKAAADAETRANHAEAGEGEARARITASEARAKDAERQAQDATTRAKHAEEWAEDLAALGDDLQRAATGDDAEFKKLREALVQTKREAASARDAKGVLEEQIATLESLGGSLRAERDGLSTERDALTAERDELLSERSALVEDAKRLEHERGSVESELASAREQLDRTKGELDETIASSKVQLANARRELEEVGAEVAAARGELDAARTREAQANTEVGSLQAELEQVRADLGSATADAEAARSAAQATSAQLAGATGELANTRREAEELAKQLEEQTERGAAAEARVVELFHQVQSLEQRPDLTPELESARGEVGELQSSLEASSERIQILEGDLAAARSEIELSQRAGAEVAGRLNEQKLRGDRAESESVELRDEIAELTNVIAELEGRPDLTADLEASAAQVAKLTQRIAELEARPDLTRDLESVRGEAGGLAAQLETATSELAASRAELEASRTETEAAKAELETARAAVGETQADEETLRQELASARAELEASRNETGTSRTQTEAANMALETVKAELAAAQAGLEGSATELARVTGELARVSSELEATTNELATIRSAAGKTEADQLTLQAELRATSEEAEARRREDEALRTELEAGRVEDARLRAELETWRVESDGLRTQLDLVKAEADGLRAESASIRAGAESLRSESTELLAEKDRLIEQLQSSEWSAGQERARAEDLARRQAELQAHADDVARKAAEEAMEARSRLMETQETLARFQAELEQTATHSVTAAQVGLDGDDIQAAVDALSTDAKRSLSAIFGLGRMISTHAPGQDEGRLLQQLMSQARRMEHALADILDAERLARGDIVLKRRSTEIDTLIRRVVREFPLIEEGQLDVVVDSATIQVDPARLERLIDDMLTTAVTRTPRGERVVLRLERTGDGVVISVEGGAPSGTEVGAAATFLAKLHGGWTSAEQLPAERGIARVFLPNAWSDRPSAQLDDADAAEPGDEDPASDPTDHAAATA